ncbi:MAG TPA: Gfo/Idh/MocA family oxidoreductase [Candidatus Paceibacterota bacterium]|nr:Gfo/Idh/MocA family oxidoreductase [Verrucomicrobiota bacterium]HSA11330.1 Gfo/Idh/MocA family oxidoreductase [Candidatus Paceibacterota bacterium]
MTDSINRRNFLKQTSALAAGLGVLGGAASLRGARSPNEKVVVAIIGCNGRGMAHISGYLALPNAEIGYICDVDSRAVEKGIAAVAKKQQRRPQGVKDFRTILEKADLDAVSIAMPEHWHAPATILACAAGKHVYIEKPGSHNLRESELMVAAARKYKRVVQMGNQRRSWPWVIESIQALHAGELGKVSFARGWYANRRTSIGRGKPAPVPEWLDYGLWQGPAPERPFQDNIIHYNWHWFWNWGTGESGNNGVHMLDLARWGLQVDLPSRITCGGNRYFYQDDWETPDTMGATFDYGDKGIAWDCQSCAPRGFEGASVGVNFYGEKGCLAMAGNNTTIYDLNNKVLREIKSKRDGLFDFDSVHFANFLDGIREGKELKSEIEEGQKSTVLCHLANIAWRTGHTINFDPKTRRIVGDEAATAFASRTYRPGWEPKV